MKSHWLAVCFLSSAVAVAWPAATLWKNNQPSYTKVCLYSNDPSKFTPMCILCPNTLYPIVLQTCVMGSAIPLNVSYTQANCIVGNCAVNMNPKIPNPKIKREVTEPQPDNGDDSKSVADSIFGSDLPTIPSIFEESKVQSVPYTIVVDGHNVTITSVEEYFVHSDAQLEDDLLLDEDLE